MKFSIVLALVVAFPALSGISARSPAGRAPYSSACSVHPDTGRSFVTVVRHYFSFADSAELVAVGMPFKPSVVELETNDSTCSALVASYNRLFTGPDTVYRINGAFVARAGGAYVLREPVTPNYPTLYFCCDSTLTYRYHLAGLD